VPEITLTPTPADPSPSVRTPAGLYAWDPALNALRNVSVEPPAAPALPYTLEAFLNGRPWARFAASTLDGLRVALRALAAVFLTRREGSPFVQFRCGYSTGATAGWIDPSLDDPAGDTWRRWPRDWDGMLNAELRVAAGLGDRV